MSEVRPRVLVVEDEAEIRRFVRLALESESIDVFEAEGVKRGLIEAGTRRPDLLVLDLGLPDGDGVDLIRELRTWSGIPIIILSARAGEADKVVALDAGADDYLVKPFGISELLARVRAQLRRRAMLTVDGESVVRFGNVSVDLARRAVEREGEPLHLTPIEYHLLSHLISQQGRVVTHRALLKEVWGPSHVADTHYVHIHMGNLRKKVERNPSRPEHILTESGIGYRFVT